MDELVGLLAEAAALSRRASADSKVAGKQGAPQPQPPQKKAAKNGDGIKALRQDTHPVGLTAAFHDRSSLLTMVVAVEVFGPPPSLRPREHL